MENKVQEYCKIEGQLKSQLFRSTGTAIRYKLVAKWRRDLSTSLVSANLQGASGCRYRSF